MRDTVLDRIDRLLRGTIFDLDGQPMSARDWMFEFEHREIGRGIVGDTHLPNGYRISTVWLGLDHRFFGGGPPITFETMVFLDWGDRRTLACRRYTSEAAAQRGHAEFEHRWRMKARRKA